MRYRMNATNGIPANAPTLTKEAWPALELNIEGFANLYSQLSPTAILEIEKILEFALTNENADVEVQFKQIESIIYNDLINVSEDEEDEVSPPTANVEVDLVQQALENKYSPMVEIPSNMVSDLRSLDILTLPQNVNGGKGTVQGELKQLLKLFELIGFPNYSPNTLKMVGEQLFNGDPTLTDTVIKAVSEVMCEMIRVQDVERILGKPASLKYAAFCRLDLNGRKEALSKADLSLAKLLGVSQDEMGLLIANNYGKDLFTVEFLPSEKLSKKEESSKVLHYVAPIALAGGLLYLLKLVKNR